MTWFRLSLLALLVTLGASSCNCARAPVQNTLKAEGEACGSDDECESSLCDKLPGKSQVCFRKCSAVCKPGDLCTALAPNDRFACVPEKPGLCQPCALNIDCPYPGDRCLELGGTKVCARDCSFDGQCPSSYRCADGTDTNGAFVTKQCQPTSGTCECVAATAGQTRPCSETNSIGTCTGVQTCTPPNGYDACSARVPTTESCNGRDDDCNGMTDENLGDTTCGTGECRRTVSNCINGSPQVCEPAPAGTEICDDKDNDCDGVVDDGFDKASVQHCGRCNNVCAFPHAVPACVMGACAIGSCTPGFVNADGIDSNGCELMCTPSGAEICDGLDNDCDGFTDEGFQLASDPTNCGTCGRVCNVNNGNIAQYACVASQCGIMTCSTGFADCDQTYGTGCEKNVSADVANCGACNNVCTVANGTPGCASSACTVASCNAGWGNCNNQVSDGCELNVTTSVTHCGVCGNACPAALHATPVCAASMCGYACDSGWVDLDGVNGCEYQCTAIGPDVPDYPLFSDANCDGIDGDASQSIFVSTSGSDTNPGTRAAPKRTINAAIATAAAANPKKAVLVASGVYAESVTLVAGVSVYGGYNATAAWSRSTANVTTIASPTNVGVLASNLSTATELQLLRVTSSAATGVEANGGGRSSIAVHVINSAAGLTVRGCDLQAGAGSAGTNGTAGTTGATGGTGGNAGGGGSNPAAAGSGGPSSCGGSGGNGAAGVNGETNGNSGSVGNTVAGSGPGGQAGSGGAAGNCTTTSSSNGSPAPATPANNVSGGVGLNANAGAATGTLASGVYLPALGAAGDTGKPGGGGGGGGSGGGTSSGTNTFCTNCSGIDSGGGGGGGGGGCGGTGGTGGRGGGGSFAILVQASNLTVEASNLTTSTGGRGGNGGDGGAGGLGGPGGAGSVGQTRSSCTTRSGGAGANGARGGSGGQGGGGSGGPGGPSVCVAYSGTAPTSSANNCAAGPGGQGGTGGSNGIQPAQSGLTGVSTNQLSL
jgi:hypothetical protein